MIIGCCLFLAAILAALFFYDRGRPETCRVIARWLLSEARRTDERRAKADAATRAALEVEMAYVSRRDRDALA